MTGGHALVSAAWLHANSASVVILDATVVREPENDYRSGTGVFEERHIPGARHADLFDGFSDPTSSLPFTRPSLEQFRHAAPSVGLRDGAQVVVYDRLGGAWAARLWWVLRSYGFESVRVLDGGLDAWSAAGYPTVSGASPRDHDDASLALTDRADWVTSIETVDDIVAGRDGRPLVCALRQEVFDGDPRDPTSGHIPGSLCMPYPEVLDAAGLISRERTRRLADSVGLSTGGPAPVLYCGGGINATGIALALYEIGISEVTIFDGSLSEWRQDPARPLTRTQEEH